MLDATVEVRVNNIPRAQCQQLESVLSNWARLNKQHPLQQDTDDTQLMHGTLSLDVTRFINEGLLIWQDTLAAVPGAGRPADGGEVPEVPLYDRGTGELLAPAVSDSALLLPGGAAAAKRRQLAQANVGEWVDGCQFEVTEDPGPIRKRQRVSMGKCHNCGSYAHNLAKCPLPVDQKRVSAAIAEVRAERQTGNNPLAQLRRRYFDLGPAATEKDGRQQGPKPGQLSQQLAQALGMANSSAPPPWLSRMVVLGVPPRYAKQNQEEAEAGEEPMVFFKGSEDESDGGSEQADMAAGAQQPTADSGGTGAATAEQLNGADDGGSSSSSGDSDDFIPFESTGVGEAPEQQEQQQPGDLADPTEQPAAAAAAAAAEDAQQVPPQLEQQQPDTQTGGVTSPKAAEAVPGPVDAVKAPRVAFPGLNTDPPQGAAAAAWEQALREAAWMQSQMA